MKYLKEGATAVDALTKAIVSLENDSITNSGYGSNFTIKGTVECDASLMDGKTTSFGGVGAVHGIKNPIEICQQMVQENNRGLMALGRIPPMFLCSKGAQEWANQHGIASVSEDTLIEEQSFDTYLDHLQRLHDALNIDYGHDTVGAICVDKNGNIAAGVSSGGISLKSPGRIGEAAMYGSGCWAQNQSGSLPGVACSVSGTGEQIVRSRFTTKCMDRLQQEDDIHQVLSSCLKDHFLDSPFLSIYDTKSVGIITLRLTTKLEFWYGHVTESMGIGYMSSSSDKAQAFISRKAKNEVYTTSGFLV
ncbi:nucleophile aminohydrolase [Cunninghamella echinulata]|nr:nucleophile aminohydrolase [Cunninghamella echinulata]